MDLSQCPLAKHVVPLGVVAANHLIGSMRSDLEMADL